MKAGDSFHDRFPIGASSEGFSPCGISQRTLDAYLEGELPGIVDRLTVREHLEECQACREYAHEYDALTRRLVSEGDPTEDGETLWAHSPSLVDRIMDRILAGEDQDSMRHEEGVRAPSRPRVSQVPRSRPARSASLSWSRWLPRFAAAAALLVGCWAALAWVSSPLQEPRGSMTMRIEDTPGTAVLRPLVAGDSGLRWIVDSLSSPEAVADTVPAARDKVLRLYGFRTPQAVLPAAHGREGLRAFEWIVEAMRSSRELINVDCRFFLVRDDALLVGEPPRAERGLGASGPRQLPAADRRAVEFVEFRPLAWSGASREDRSIPARVNELLQPRACYRVVMVPRAVTLPRQPVMQKAARSEGILTLLEASPPETSRWVFPASIRR